MTASRFFTIELIETRFFLIRLFVNVIKIMNLTILKLYPAKLTRISFFNEVALSGAAFNGISF